MISPLPILWRLFSSGRKSPDNIFSRLTIFRARGVLSVSLRTYCGRFFGFPKKVPTIYFPVRRFFLMAVPHIYLDRRNAKYSIGGKIFLGEGIVLPRGVLYLRFLPFAPDAVPAPCFKTASHRSRRFLCPAVLAMSYPIRPVVRLSMSVSSWLYFYLLRAGLLYYPLDSRSIALYNVIWSDVDSRF